MKPPPLRDDCFALPAGVEWTPVSTAFAHLRDNLVPVAETMMVPVGAADGLYLAEAPTAQRANPPTANSAVDGYGFAAARVPDGDVALPLVEGRAAAGVPLGTRVPAGFAVRILTGAALPDGVDTVVLEEDCTVAPGRIAFRGTLKPFANTRRAGEDFDAGTVLFDKGHRLGPQDLALLAAAGLGTVRVHRPLRVAVLSTGDELCAPGAEAAAHQIYDANRPMLLALLARWGFVPVDLGCCADDADAVRVALDAAAADADVLITSGGASAGDEDHVSATLRTAGAMALWRIAIKPGRPLALGLWRGMPVFGLPGNPVAAFVCALVFAAPALRRLAGGAFQLPRGQMVPAAFAKAKKPGRREFLRARLNADGHAEVFRSEGSGRISGLAWADGLVELPDAAADIRPGTPVRYIPYGAFAP
ncbi:molybdopterin-binding protein [Acuticoccus sp. MNP-M23]|uniref:molybdopterin-binding protein n=1 Tax=Acuticoccus sp. MNP-M23 TaxID=3072793 RepID=UPI0028156AAC|nr:gephyrin-like molybdotransferase Glp [Acuticoccus sp. MNP-M23]WMS41019.1 molybdopterin-binding protein [Acuticoccus sp. MNP-M23]